MVNAIDKIVSLFVTSSSIVYVLNNDLKILAESISESVEYFYKFSSGFIIDSDSTHVFESLPELLDQKYLCENSEDIIIENGVFLYKNHQIETVWKIFKYTVYGDYIVVVCDINLSKHLFEENISTNQAIAALPGSVYWKDREGRYLGCNKFVAELIGLDNLDKVIGKTDREIANSDIASEWQRNDEMVMLSQETLTVEERVRLKNNEVRTFFVTKRPLYDRQKKVIGIVGNSLDITEKKVLEKELETAKKNSSMYLNHIIANIPGYVYWKDIDLKYLGCNDAYLEYLGLKDKELIIGKTDLCLNNELHENDYSKKRLREEKDIIKNGNNYLGETTKVLHDNESHTYLENKVPLRNEKNEVVGLIGMTMDITERKKMEEERLVTIQSLGASMAHELRTPLAAIDNYFVAIRRYLPTLVDSYIKNNNLENDIHSLKLKKLEGVTDSIAKEIRNANLIITMLMMKIELHQSAGKKRAIERQSIVETVNSALDRYPLSKSELEMLNSANLKDFIYVGDKLLIEHIIFNLLKNSLYYIGKEKKGEIDIYTEYHKDNNLVIFKDNGKGIPKEILPKLFTWFFSTNPKGNGLGLGFCKTAMKSIDGDITCESEYGHYTKMILKFPSKKGI